MDALLKENIRIKELMGFQVTPYNKDVISEASTGAVDDILTSLFGKFKSNKLYQTIDPKVFDDVFIAGKKSPNSIIKKELKNIDSLDSFVANLDEFSDETLKYVFRELAGKGVPEIDAVLMESIAEILAGTDVSDLARIVDEYNTADEFIEFMQGGSDLPLPKFVEDSLRRFFRKTSLGDLADSADYIKLNISKLAKAANAKGGKTWFGDFYRALFKDTEKIKARMIALSEQFANDMDTITDPVKAQELIDAYSVAISRELNLLEMQANKGAAKALMELDIDSRLKNVIQNSDKDTFKIFREIRREDPSNFASNIYDLGKRFFGQIIPRVEIGENIKNIIPFRKQMLNWIGGTTPTTSNMKKGAKWIKVVWPEDLKQYLITGQWAKFSKLYKIAVKNSSASSKAAVLSYAMVSLIYAEYGSIMANVIYDAGQALASSLNIQLGINKIFTSFGLDAPYPNAEAESQEEFESFIEEFIVKTGRNLKETFADGEFEWAIPIVGTFEKSALSKLLAWASGNPKGYGVGDVWTLLKDAANGLTSGLSSAWDAITGQGKEEGIDFDEEGTLELTVDAVKEAAPELVKNAIWEKDGEILIASYREEKDSSGNTIQVPVDYKVFIENNEYVVDIGTQKIKLSDYK